MIELQGLELSSNGLENDREQLYYKDSADLEIHMGINRAAWKKMKFPSNGKSESYKRGFIPHEDMKSKFLFPDE